MPEKSVLELLDTSKVADGFDTFLAAQGLGEMNPSMASRYKNGVEASPMDEILALNGKNLDDLFAKKLPEPPPLEGLSQVIGSSSGNASQNDGKTPVKNTQTAIKSLGLDSKALGTLETLLNGGINQSIDDLPPALRSLVMSEDNFSVTDIITSMSRLYTLITKHGQNASEDFDLASLMLRLKNELGIRDSTELLSLLEAKPEILRELLRDPAATITLPLWSTTRLLHSSSRFSVDSITGSTASETLLASRIGGSRLHGGGGRDLYVFPLVGRTLIPATFIEDYDPLTGSKIVIDLTDYDLNFNRRFRVAANKRKLKKHVASNANLIFDERSHSLLLNANKKQKGLGRDSGGVIAHFLNSAQVRANDIFLYNGSLMDLDGNSYSSEQIT